MIFKAILRSFDAATYTASVQLVGSLAVYLTSVPVARNIAAAELTAGRIATIVIYDVTTPADVALIAIHT